MNKSCSVPIVSADIIVVLIIDSALTLLHKAQSTKVQKHLATTCYVTNIKKATL